MKSFSYIGYIIYLFPVLLARLRYNAPRYCGSCPRIRAADFPFFIFETVFYEIEDGF
jgi:hypothetical protein